MFAEVQIKHLDLRGLMHIQRDNRLEKGSPSIGRRYSDSGLACEVAVSRMFSQAASNLHSTHLLRQSGPGAYQITPKPSCYGEEVKSEGPLAKAFALFSCFGTDLLYRQPPYGDRSQMKRGILSGFRD